MERRRPDAPTSSTVDTVRWVATPQCQPINADSRRGYFRTTLTTGPAGLPHPAAQALLLDTSTWTVAHNCPIAQVRYTLSDIVHQRRCALRHPFPANLLSQAVPPTWISTTPPGRRRRRLFFVNMSRVYSVNTVNQLTGLFTDG